MANSVDGLAFLTARGQPSLGGDIYSLVGGHPVIHAGFQRFPNYLDGELIAPPTGETWRERALNFYRSLLSD